MSELTVARSFPMLAITGEFLNDCESMRIRTENRVRALEESPDGTSPIELIKAQELLEVAESAEKEANVALLEALSDTPFVDWISERHGVGEKSAARLLGTIGHPRWRYDNEKEEWFPRKVDQLWSYCGYAVVNGKAPEKKRNQQSNWNDKAKDLVWVIADVCMKDRKSPFRKDYDEAKRKYVDAKHDQECRRCGPSGKPAQPGSDLADGHKHARAMRATSKAILKDLWLWTGENLNT